MCIICTEEIYTYDLDTLVVLDVSYCLNLTSEKLQEVLIRCKNLETLRCYYCRFLTSLDLRNNIKLETLECSYCKSLTSLDLRSVNLEELYCHHCISLTSLDLRNNMNLKILWCSYISLTSLDLRNNMNLKILNCYSCTSLTSLDLRNDIEIEYNNNIRYSKCPWIPQNKEFPNNLHNLIKLQKWYRRIVLIKYMKTKQFIEWIYNPNNIGARLYKVKLLKEFT